MANLTFDGLDSLMVDLRDYIGMSDEMVGEMLEAGAEVLKDAIGKEAEQLGMYENYHSTANNTRSTTPDNSLPGQTKSYSTGELARSLKVAKLEKKDGQAFIRIYFSGSRLRGKSRTRNSEIAFLNEYGTRTINARHFVWTAIESSGSTAVERAKRVMDEYMESKNL